MAFKYAITTQGPLVGATTLGEWLHENRGFMHVRMSTKLVEAYLKDRGIASSMLETILMNKENFRPELREFAIRSGFHTEPRWMKYCLEEWLAYKPERDVVIEKVRTNEQARTLKNMGFQIIELAISRAEHVRRAESAWVTEQELEAMLQSPVEQGIDERLLDSVIIAEGPVYIYGSWLANRDLQKGTR